MGSTFDPSPPLELRMVPPAWPRAATWLVLWLTSPALDPVAGTILFESEDEDLARGRLETMRTTALARRRAGVDDAQIIDELKALFPAGAPTGLLAAGAGALSAVAAGTADLRVRLAREECFSAGGDPAGYATLSAGEKSGRVLDLGRVLATKAGLDLDAASARVLLPHFDRARRMLEATVPGAEAATLSTTPPRRRSGGSPRERGDAILGRAELLAARDGKTLGGLDYAESLVYAEAAEAELDGRPAPTARLSVGRGSRGGAPGRASPRGDALVLEAERLAAADRVDLAAADLPTTLRYYKAAEAAQR